VAQDVAFDPRPARLQAALDDRIYGLESDYFSNDEAVARIDADLQRLGLLGGRRGTRTTEAERYPRTVSAPAPGRSSPQATCPPER